MKIIDWHSGFVSAMKLELIANEKDLVYDEEHPLANRAQRIDLLIIRNDSSARIVNPIGERFSKFNICEYKSPGQSLTYGDFYKILAYTGLYLNETQHGRNYNANDYSMTFVRESHPYNLFKRLADDGVRVEDSNQGIYRLYNNLPFKTQVIVTKEIPDNRKSWLKCLTRSGTVSELESIVENTPALDKHNKRYADNMMDIFTSANRALVRNQLKEEPEMCNAVNELFADEIAEMKVIIANKDALITKLQNDRDSLLANKDSVIAKINSQLNDKDSVIADKDALIATLRAELDKYTGKGES